MKQAWIMKAAALVWLALAALTNPAAAQQQQQQRDPFNGLFGAFELAFPPAEAARQADLIAGALAGLAPQRPGQVDVYILVASFWGDPVFEREATQAEAILREHFAADGRTVLLSAGAGAAPRRFPAASPNNVSAAMGRIGALIDPNEDMVVVFLTSHGAPDGSMALRETNRLSASLRPPNLRDSFQQANIRNRVVIVSACFSGAFIAPLMDENTAIFTAAAPDRSSFGCQPENDWTFFGDAYFNHAVRGGAGLVRAFDEAKTLIERWERDRNLTPPSNPQRYVGARIGPMLARAEREARD